MGHEVTVCPDGLTAVAALERNTYDCILVDLDMPGLSRHPGDRQGQGAFARHRCRRAHRQVVARTAVAALRHGAFDYLTKPCKLVELEALLNRVAEKRELTNKYPALKRQLGTGRRHDASWSATRPAWNACDKLIAKVAPTEFDRADPRRNRHRQGTGRPGRARPEPAGARCRSWRSTAARCPRP